MAEQEPDFGETLRLLIRESGMNQKEFATRALYSPQYITDIILGRRSPPPLHRVKDMGQILGDADGRLMRAALLEQVLFGIAYASPADIRWLGETLFAEADSLSLQSTPPAGDAID